MKLLFDQNLSFKLCRQLADLFPGSSPARLVGLDQAHDRMLWDFARTHDYTLVSLVDREERDFMLWRI
jgi:predicted nuclease of predicted toxin-antitoxin system